MTDLPDHVVTIVLFATPDEALILRLADATHPHMVQTCWPTDAIGPDRERRLREKLNRNGIAVIKEIPVGGPDSRAQALAAAQRYEHGADSLILDTFKDPRWIGATGEVHDWSISRTIVQLVDCPCILAGGLADDNVEQALAAVEPWGVDSYTRTNLPDGRKDIEKVRALVAAVRQFDAARRPLRSGE